MLNNTKTKVCTNHAKIKSCLRRPKRNPVPSARVICGTKLVNGDRVTLAHTGSTDTAAAGLWAGGYVRYTR